MPSLAPSASQHQTMNRFEVKYLVPTKDIPELLEEFAPYTRPDPYSSDWGYSINSVYWDTRDFTLFWEKIEGVKYRRKLRFRRYGDSPEIFVEIKGREDRTLHKRRIRWPLERVSAAFGDDTVKVDWSLVQGDEVATEVALMIERLRLRPRMSIRYRRRALFGQFDPELRITFDGRLVYHPQDFSLARPFEEGRSIIDPRVTVLEVKYDHRAPIWLTKAICERGLQIVRMSKYCTAVDKHYYGGQNT